MNLQFFVGSFFLFKVSKDCQRTDKKMLKDCHFVKRNNKKSFFQNLGNAEIFNKSVSRCICFGY